MNFKSKKSNDEGSLPIPQLNKSQQQFPTIGEMQTIYNKKFIIPKKQKPNNQEKDRLNYLLQKSEAQIHGLVKNVEFNQKLYSDTLKEKKDLKKENKFLEIEMT